MTSPLTAVPWLAAGALTLVGCLPILLPGQREAMKRLFDHATSREPSAEAAIEFSFGYRMAAMIWVVGLIGSAAFGMAFNAIERTVARIIAEGPPPPNFRAPGLVNGYDSLKELFGTERQESGEEDRLIDSIPSNFSHALPHLVAPDLYGMALAKARPEDLAAYFDRHSLGFEKIERARHADYFYYPQGENFYFPKEDTPKIGKIRAPARAMAFRSIVRMNEGRHAEAAEDIDLLYHLGLISQSDGTLWQYMIGLAIIRLATDSAYHYWLWNRDNPTNLALLEKALERHAPLIHRSFNFDMMRRSEFGWWPVVIYPELTAPGFLRAVEEVHLKWLEFDFILLAVKLELYRAKHGAYPDALDALVPETLVKLPLDPSDGSPLTYENLGNEFELTTKFHQDVYKKRYPDSIAKNLKLRFPASEVLEDPETRKAVEAWAPPMPPP